jgi:putative FmdB family regulatory protein
MKLKISEDKVMPVYEYHCRKCGEAFELLEKEKGQNPNCPKCNSPETEKKLSIFGSLTQKGKKIINECNTSFS